MYKLKKEIIERIIKESDYIIETNKTIREVASQFKISKSTVHKDLHERLKNIDIDKFSKVQTILKYHLDIRHIRGGQSTKKKYLKLSNPSTKILDNML